MLSCDSKFTFYDNNTRVQPMREIFGITTETLQFTGSSNAAHCNSIVLFQPCIYPSYDMHNAVQGSHTRNYYAIDNSGFTDIYLDAVGDGLGNKRHVCLDIRKWDTREQRCIVVIAPKLSHHEEGLAEVVLALCSITFNQVKTVIHIHR